MLCCQKDLGSNGSSSSYWLCGIGQVPQPLWASVSPSDIMYLPEWEEEICTQCPTWCLAQWMCSINDADDNLWPLLRYVSCILSNLVTLSAEIMEGTSGFMGSPGRIVENSTGEASAVVQMIQKGVMTATADFVLPLSLSLHHKIWGSKGFEVLWVRKWSWCL